MSESASPIRWAQPSSDATAVTAGSSGDNTIYTPATGKAVGLQYICLSADGANTADVTATVKFGAGGAAKYKLSLKPGAIWARNIGARMRWLAGAVDEALIVNLSAVQNVHVSAEVEDV